MVFRSGKTLKFCVQIFVNNDRSVISELPFKRRLNVLKSCLLILTLLEESKIKNRKIFCNIKRFSFWRLWFTDIGLLVVSLHCKMYHWYFQLCWTVWTTVFSINVTYFCFDNSSKEQTIFVFFIMLMQGQRRHFKFPRAVILQIACKERKQTIFLSL